MYDIICYNETMILADLLFPKLCVGCGYLGTYLCGACEKKLKVVQQDTCVYCNQTSYFGLTHPGCRQKLGTDGVLSIFYYNFILKRIVKYIKYRLAYKVWDDFRTIIKPDISKKIYTFIHILKNPVFQPIPLHHLKEKARGFNQSLMLARYFSETFHIPIVHHIERKKKTMAQAQINTKMERYKNIRGAFFYTEKAHGSTNEYILVDDIFTSGLTIHEASKTLKLHGAKTVFALTLGKG